jgi:hypothetical protein
MQGVCAAPDGQVMTCISDDICGEEVDRSTCRDGLCKSTDLVCRNAAGTCYVHDNYGACECIGQDEGIAWMTPGASVGDDETVTICVGNLETFCGTELPPECANPPQICHDYAAAGQRFQELCPDEFIPSSAELELSCCTDLADVPELATFFQCIANVNAANCDEAKLAIDACEGSVDEGDSEDDDVECDSGGPDCTGDPSEDDPASTNSTDSTSTTQTGTGTMAMQSDQNEDGGCRLAGSAFSRKLFLFSAITFAWFARRKRRFSTR